MTSLPNTENSTPFAQQIITQVINAWAGQNKAGSAFFNKYADADYSGEVAPGRNRAIYLLGHLIAVNDGMLPMFGLGERLYPELEKPFISQADKTSAEMPSITELRGQWEALNAKLAAGFAAMSVADWMGRHSLVSEADFAINPLRNKLNVLIGRTNHQSYHLGQVNLLHAAPVAVAQ